MVRVVGGEPGRTVSLKSRHPTARQPRHPVCHLVPEKLPFTGTFQVAFGLRRWHRSCICDCTMTKTCLLIVCLLTVSSVAVGCAGSTEADGSDPGGDATAGGSGGTEGPGGGNATGADAGVGGTYEEEDCSWSAVPQVTCEDFEGLEANAIVNGVNQGQLCPSVDSIQEALATRGIDFEIVEDGAGGAGGASSSGCPASDVLFLNGITYGGGCGTFDYRVCPGEPVRSDDNCCYPTLRAGFSGCCG